MKQLILLFFLIFANCTFGQEVDSAVAMISYHFKHVNDTTAPDKFLQDDVATFIGQHSSYYMSYSRSNVTEQMNKQMNAPDFDGNIVLERTTSNIRENYLVKPAERIMKEIRILAGDQFVLEVAYPELDWEVAAESKDIGGYTCQKATCNFKGREYIAWFTTELPFSYGPWKLHGLPGLILEAYDSKQEVVFNYAGFEKDSVNYAIEIREFMIPATVEEFEKQKKAFEKDPAEYSKARRRNITTVSGRASGVASSNMNKIKSMTIKNAESYQPSKTTNNPIELIP